MAKKKASFKWGPLSDRQYTILKWWSAGLYKDYDGIIADGSIRSGKTISMAPSFVFWAMTNFKGMDFAMCGKTINSLRRNVTNTLKKQINQRNGWSAVEKRNENLIVISHNGIENNFYLFGGKDEASQDLIQGVTLAGILFDEVALMPESFVNQATGRCSVDGSKFWFNCNPAGPEHWFKVNWINQRRKKNLLYIHFTMEDNLSLSQRIRERYASMYSGVFYQRYILGLWVKAEGLIFDMFDKSKHVSDDVPELDGEYYISADYGIQNDNVFLLWKKASNSKTWWCLDECRYRGREVGKQKTVSELVDDLDEFLKQNGNIKPRWIIVDPSASALKVELKKRKYRVKNANNKVKEGIEDVSSALKNEQIRFTSKCKGTIKEFGLYSWDEKAADRGEDKPIKTNDHGMDAVRYFVKTMKLIKRYK